MIRKILFVFLFALTSQLTLAQAPGNDCASASPITLAPGTTVSTGLQSNTGLANNYSGLSNAGCGTPNNIFFTAVDGVYSINVVLPGDYTFAFANNGSIRKTLALYNACPISIPTCEPGTSLHTGTQRDGSITVPLTVGTYYILIDGLISVGIPAFELLVTTPIGNDECVNAAELFSSVDCSYVTYTNAGATASPGAPAPTCANYQGGDVWFSYEVNVTGEFTITTEAGVMTDSGMAVYSGTCGSLTQLACDDDFGTGNMSTINISGRTPGEIVYIRLWEWGNNNNGTFGICVTTPIPPGDNGVYQDCPNERGLELTSDFVCAPGLNSSDVVFGNLLGQPTAFRQFSSANSAVCNTNVGASRRYEAIDFTVPTTGFYVIEMTAMAGFDGMGYIIVNDGLYTIGSCATGTFVIGDDDSAPGFTLRPELSVNLTAGVNYTLVTTEFSIGSGNSPYTWTVTSGPDINWLSTVQIDWYTAASGGTYLKTGPGFRPVNFPGSGLTDTSTPGIFSYWYECSSNPGVRTQVDYVIGKVWDGSASSDWSNPLNWSNDTVPNSSQCVYIQSGTGNDPIIPDNFDGDALNLTIQTGASLTLSSDTDTNSFGSSLTVQENINIQGAGVLTVQDDANLVQVNDTPSVANSGNIVYERDTNIRRLDYVYWSSPVQGYDVSNIYGAFTPTNHIYEWLPTTATSYFGMPGTVPIVVGNWNNLAAGAMSLGKGYALRGPSNHSVGLSIATATFNGAPNNGVITQPIVSGGYSAGSLIYNPYGTDNLIATDKDDNWNLIGNPYPSAIDADAFLMHPSNALIEGAVHIWTHGTQLGANGDSFYDDFLLTYSPSDYITYNLLGVTNPNPVFSGNIATGQGFFVLALNDNEAGSVTFNNSMRGAGIRNSDFYRNSETSEDTTVIERHRIWLNLVNNQNGSSSNILVGYIEGASQEKDRLYDAYAREANNLSLYSKIGDERMIIQGRALPFDENDQIPLGTVIPQPGEYTIAISSVDGLFGNDNQSIYLEDTYSGIIHNLRAAPYTFMETAAIDYEDRFLLRYTNEALSIDETDMTAFTIIAPKGAYIKINSNSNPIEAVTVYDLLGRTLINEFNLNTSEFVINNHNLNSGAYLVKATLSNGLSKTQKVVLKD